MSDVDNTFVGVVVPKTIIASLVADSRSVEGKKAKAHSELGKEFVEKLLDEYVAQGHLTPPVVPDPPALTLEDASKIILQHLHPEHRGLIEELAAEGHRPLSAYVLSPVMLAKDHGQVGVLVGEWADVEKPTEVHAKLKAGTCEECGKPVKPGTRFCPLVSEDVDSCGQINAHKVMVAARESKRIQKPSSPFAPKPSALIRQFAMENAAKA